VPFEKAIAKIGLFFAFQIAFFIKKTEICLHLKDFDTLLYEN